MRGAWASFFAVALASGALADNYSGGGGGSGGGGVTSLSTSCPAQAGQPLTGAITLPFGVGPVVRNPVAGTTDTLLAGDCGQSIEYTSGSAIAVTVPQAGTTGFLSGYVVNVTMKSGSGTATFTTTTSVFSSTNAVTFTLVAGQSATLQSDGTNWNVYSGTSPTYGTGAQTALGTAVNTTGGFTTQNGAVTSGDCLKASSGVSDYGSPCIGPIHPGYITGGTTWYTPFLGVVAVTGNVQVANTVYCTPGYITIPVTIKALGSHFSTGDTGGNVSWAVYTNSTTTHRPGTLVDYATTTTPTTGIDQSATMHNTTDLLATGVYWWCETQDNATGVMNAVAASTNLSVASNIGGATVVSVSSTAGNSVGVTCLVSTTTCGGQGSGWGIWSAGAFTWGVTAASMWTTVTNATIPVIAFEPN